MSNLVLGLDLGPNSIGWALVDDDAKSATKSRLVNLGVRVFPEGVDNFDTSKELSRNEDRRIARGMRRQIRRRARRRKLLKEALIASRLWPADPTQESALYETNPYDLRARGLRERLEPFEFGRVLLHLNQRRGFLSNRKKDRGDKEVQGMLAEINELAADMQRTGSGTIGAHFAKSLADDPLKPVRGLHTRRSMFESEFELLWSTQAKHHPQLLTDTLKFGEVGQQSYPQKPIAKHDPRRRGLPPLAAFGVYGLIFFQRPMYWPKSVVGLCEFEPKQKRCPRADRHAQRFRLLQEVNNLRYSDPDLRSKDEQPLTEGQRAMVLELLAVKEKVTFDQIRKKLGFLESVKFNLERGERSTLKGMIVDVLMAAAVGKSWHERPESERDAIVRLLINNEREDALVIEQLVNQFGFTRQVAEAALDVDFPAGYANLSLVAIDKLLPHLERGLVYQSVSDPEKSALHAAGYLRRDELRRRLFDVLPNPSRCRPGDLRIGDIPNPVVKRALVELRKVVNAIIREYGKPAAVHLEMARSMQMGKERRVQLNKDMRDREAQRESAADAVRKLNVKLSRDAILRYLLWEEQSHECIYCGKAISQKQLFTGEADVDHILPYSRTLDDSQMNKVVCHRKCNHGKGQATPYEWLAATHPDDYDRLCLHAGSLLKKGLLPYRKYRRFLQRELELDKFIARQLTDTGYIAQATGEFLRCLFEKDHHVLGLKGQLTAELRWQWGLGTVLEEMPDSPAWHENNNDLRPGEKNRADHRHHAIDAVVVALTNRSRLQKLSHLIERGGARAHGEVLDDPWPNFRDDIVTAVRKLKVSYRVERKVAGKLHKETLYGPTPIAGEWAVRKPVDSLSAAEIDHIRDDTIRNIVIARLKEHGIDFGRGKKPEVKKLKEALVGLEMPSGVPIKKVRITVPELTIQSIRERTPEQAFVKPGSTHHLCLFEIQDNGKSKYDAVFVTMLEAMNRLKRREQVIQRMHPTKPEAKYIMSLATRELVLLQIDGEERLYSYHTAASTTKQMTFYPHTAAKHKGTLLGKLTKYPSSFMELEPKKVTVDPLGRIRWAND